PRVGPPELGLALRTGTAPPGSLRHHENPHTGGATPRPGVADKDVVRLRDRITSETRLGINNEGYAFGLARLPRRLDRLPGSDLSVGALQRRDDRPRNRDRLRPRVEPNPPDGVDRHLVEKGRVLPGGGHR